MSTVHIAQAVVAVWVVGMVAWISERIAGRPAMVLPMKYPSEWLRFVNAGFIVYLLVRVL